jgi:hypothetical protein
MNILNLKMQKLCKETVMHNMGSWDKLLKYDFEVLILKVFNEFSSSAKKLQKLKTLFCTAYICLLL